MKKEEVSYLKGIRKTKGMKDTLIENEITSFMNTQKGFRLLKKECRTKDTIIKNLEKRIKSLNNKLESLSKAKRNKNKPLIKSNSGLGKDIFKETISKQEEKKIKRLVLRIKTSMEDKSYTKNLLIKELMIPSKRVDACIKQLIKEDFFSEKMVRGYTRYFKK